MNGTRAVDEEMTERVRAAARELDYFPSPLARSLVLGRTNTVAVVVPDLGNPTFHGVLRGLSHAASQNGYPRAGGGLGRVGERRAGAGPADPPPLRRVWCSSRRGWPRPT